MKLETLRALIGLMNEPSTTLVMMLVMWGYLSQRLQKLEKRRCCYARRDLAEAEEEPPEVA